jgi:hypothetical protein
MMSPGTRKKHFYFDLSGVSWLQKSARKEMPLHSGIFLLILTKIAYALSLNCCVEIVVQDVSRKIRKSKCTTDDDMFYLIDHCEDVCHCDGSRVVANLY